MKEQTKVTGVILAGGLARRMGNRDKGLAEFNGKPLVSYAIVAMRPIVDELIINANRNMEEYRRFGLPVIADQTDSFDGPLAGILTACVYAQSGIVLVAPCDSPFFEQRHCHKLLSAREEHGANIAVAFDSERIHPVFLALKVDLMADLQAYLHSGQRKVETWLARHKPLPVDFSGEPEIFRNINSLAELKCLEESRE
jgi:molybdenum cofactor guanylyltransferase